jgi:hypothetical protein
MHAGSGTIDVKELRTALSALGQSPTDEELFVMISQVCMACMAWHASMVKLINRHPGISVMLPA